MKLSDRLLFCSRNNFLNKTKETYKYVTMQHIRKHAQELLGSYNLSVPQSLGIKT